MKNSSAAFRHSSLSLRAPAKINWFLKVIGKRDDGYHNIISLMQCISLYDELMFEHSDTIEVLSDLDIPLKDNIVFKAASLLKRYTLHRGGAKIVLHKDIPISAGLGGGSSDAAYTLSGLNMLWGLELNNGELSSIGMEIGSDVPFFLNGPSALVESRGEKITPFKINSSFVILLVKPPISVSTPWAYTYFDSLRIDTSPVEPVSSMLTKETFDIKLFCQALMDKNLAFLGNMINNDLEKVVVEKYPVVGKVKERLLERGAIFSSMSGSGSTVFGVFGSQEEALSVTKEMGSNWCRVVQTLTTVDSIQ